MLKYENSTEYCHLEDKGKHKCYPWTPLPLPSLNSSLRAIVSISLLPPLSPMLSHMSDATHCCKHPSPCHNLAEVSELCNAKRRIILCSHCKEKRQAVRKSADGRKHPLQETSVPQHLSSTLVTSIFPLFLFNLVASNLLQIFVNVLICQIS